MALQGLSAVFRFIPGPDEPMNQLWQRFAYPFQGRLPFGRRPTNPAPGIYPTPIDTRHMGAHVRGEAPNPTVPIEVSERAPSREDVERYR
jgi:hypothetical protein